MESGYFQGKPLSNIVPPIDMDPSQLPMKNQHITLLQSTVLNRTFGVKNDETVLNPFNKMSINKNLNK